MSPISGYELPNCLSREWLTVLKRCYWLVSQEYNKDDECPHFCINQNKNIDNDIYCNSNKFPNLLFYELWENTALQSLQYTLYNTCGNCCHFGLEDVK